MSVSKAAGYEFMEDESLIDSIWSDEDEFIYSEFGKKMDSLGRRVYEIFIDDWEK